MTRNIALIVAACLLLTSCYSVSSLETDVLNPATYSFSQDIYRVGVISRMDLDPAVKDPSLNSLQRMEVSRQRELLNNGVSGLLDGLAESPRFEAYQVKTSTSLSERERPLDLPIKWNIIDKLARKDTLDFIISLVAVNYEDTVMRPADLFPDGDWSNSNIPGDQDIEDRDMKYRSYILFPYLYWRLYDLRLEEQSSHIQIDTLIFYPGPEKGYPSSSDRIKLFSDIVGDQAYKYSKALAPYWTTENRAWYVTGDPLLRKARSLAEEGDWIGASEIWIKLSESTSKPLAARACFNMALACEMLDQFDVALEWVEKSKDMGLDYYPDHYKAILLKRQLDKSKLDEQMK